MISLIVTYPISLALTLVLWYLLKHACFKKRVRYRTYSKVPYRVKRKEAVQYILLMLVPGLNLATAITSLVLLKIQVDMDDVVIDLGERQERMQKSVNEWMDKDFEL